MELINNLFQKSWATNFKSRANISTAMDWDKTQNSEDEIFEKFKSSLHNGVVVLLHDFDFTNSNAQIKALEKIIIYGKSLGFTFVTVYLFY